MKHREENNQRFKIGRECQESKWTAHISWLSGCLWDFYHDPCTLSWIVNCELLIPFQDSMMTFWAALKIAHAGSAKLILTCSRSTSKLLTFALNSQRINELCELELYSWEGFDHKQIPQSCSTFKSSEHNTHPRKHRNFSVEHFLVGSFSISDRNEMEDYFSGILADSYLFIYYTRKSGSARSENKCRNYG